MTRAPASPRTAQPRTARTLGIREGGGRGRSRESTPREFLAQGAFQLRRLQPGPARRIELQLRGPTARPDLPKPWNLPPTRGTLSFRVENVGAPRRAETRKTTLSHQTLGYLRPPRAPAGQAFQLQCPDDPVRNEWPALASRARLGPEVRRWQRLEPGRPAPERRASSGLERTSEPRPPSSAPDSRRLSRPRGGAADASRRLPAFSISPFSP